jgi:hypothetical protein
MDRRDVGPSARIVQDLREQVDRVLEAVIEAVHEEWPMHRSAPRPKLASCRFGPTLGKRP